MIRHAVATLCWFAVPLVAGAQQPGTRPSPLSTLAWRNIGPNRGGRSIAVGASSARPNEYYFGATGGGLWKTQDGGTTWGPVTDGQINSSSVGAVAVAESNPDVVYIGMGETQFRGNIMQGDGVYRSIDGGRTWAHAGLERTQAIGRVRVDPRDPDRVYVAALGHPFGPNADRGVFRTTDGGRTWRRVLFRNDSTGAVDLAIDPGDPNVLYATLWQVYRKPWILWSGGEGSGLFKSTDGGDSWTELTRNPGLPRGVLGKITVTVSGADSRRLWANVEAAEGGLYRSDDAGATWQRVNAHRDLWQRAFYFLRVVADPRDRETVYVLSFQLERSTDGGATFTPVRTPHVDHHDLWIDPRDPRRMINANDGGAVVSTNGGATWTSQRYPTAQLYRVATTDEAPYHACGAQQDNTTVCVPVSGVPLAPPGAAAGDWFYEVGGGESADVAPRPGAPDIFYAGSTNTLTRFDRRTGQSRDIQPNPRIVMGEPASAMPERWNWTYPVAVSRRDPRLLYVGSQHLWKTTDEGRTWRRISPDLTRANPATLGNSGGPIVFDQDGPEVYATIFTIAPSRHDTSTIWVGSDDGLVHLTRNGGRSWHNVTPPDLPANTRVSRIDASPHRSGGAVIAAERHQMDDRAPYAWVTDDFGVTWTRIVDGIPGGAFIRVLREDPVRPGLLFAGTEHGVFVSFDRGARWRPLSLNLPDVQVSDLVVHQRDVVIATHGRSFWVLDDIGPLRHVTSAMLDGTEAHPRLFAPAPAMRGISDATIDYYLPRGSDSAVVVILDADGRLVQTLDARSRREGLHRARWDLTFPGATSFPGIVLEGGDPRRGVRAPPGRYRVRLTAFGRGGNASETRELVVARDPRLVDVTDRDLRAQFELATRIRDAESAANQAVLDIRALRTRLHERVAQDTLALVPAMIARINAAVAPLEQALADVEAAIYQVRNQSPKDKIAFPIRLNDRLTGLRSIVETGDAPPTDAQQRVYRELRAELDRHLGRLDASMGAELGRLNAVLREAGLAPIPRVQPAPRARATATRASSQGRR